MLIDFLFMRKIIETELLKKALKVPIWSEHMSGLYLVHVSGLCGIMFYACQKCFAFKFCSFYFLGFADLPQPCGCLAAV